MLEVNKRQGLLAFGSLVGLGILVSQVGSSLITTHLPVGQTWALNSFVFITHVRNYGGVFGSFQGMGWIFALVALILISGLVLYLVHSSTTKLYEYLCFGCIAGGGISNILDRLIYGSVVDFINLQHIPYWHYIFNTADVLIHVGIWPMLLFTFLDRKLPPSTPTPTELAED
ncbi:MAG: signal peptidase II [Nitrospirae bacterium]|nr:signal peptidase II [Nitrospirota bacterium]